MPDRGDGEAAFGAFESQAGALPPCHQKNANLASAQIIFTDSGKSLAKRQGNNLCRVKNFFFCCFIIAAAVCLIAVGKLGKINVL